MKILGIDSSGNVASVSLLIDDVMVGEYTINNNKTHSQTLLPMIEAMLSMAEMDVSELDAIAIASGPGSFTGLRIGAATAKGLAGALDIPIIPIPTLEALALNGDGWEGIICPLMDARRNQAYFGIYECHNGEVTVCEKQGAMSIEEIIEKVNKMGKKVKFLGDGVSVFYSYIVEKIQVPFTFALPQNNQQRAGCVVALSGRYWNEKKTVMATEFVPTYIRLSQAERERLHQKS